AWTNHDRSENGRHQLTEIAHYDESGRLDHADISAPGLVGERAIRRYCYHGNLLTRTGTVWADGFESTYTCFTYFRSGRLQSVDEDFLSRSFPGGGGHSVRYDEDGREIERTSCGAEWCYSASHRYLKGKLIEADDYGST